MAQRVGRPTAGRARGPARWALAMVAAAAVAGLPATPAGATPAGAAPLAVTFAAGPSSWAAVPMGDPRSAANTFWQLFSRPSAGGAWRLVTPPGVADNGGLSTSGPSSASVAVGFQPTARLSFSPLARSTDGGSTWSAGLLAQPLALSPDALSAIEGPSGFAERALVRTGGGRVLFAGADLSVWTAVTDRAVLAATPAGRRCGLEALTAVVARADGSTLIGGVCRRSGVLPLFADGPAGWRAIGPPARPGGPWSVARLVGTADGGLVALVTGPVGVGALWSADGGVTWTASPIEQADGAAAGDGREPG